MGRGREEGRKRKDPFHYTANKQAYSVVWGSFNASLLMVCGLLAGKLILEHFISRRAGELDLNVERDNETVCCFKAIP